MTRKLSLEIITSLLVLLFVYAAFSKLMDFRSFRVHLEVTPYVGSFARSLSILLPAGELLIVILLLRPQARLAGLWLSFITMILFTIYVALMLLTQQHLPCTCGGFIQKLSWPQHLVMNIIFTIVALAGIILNNRLRTGNAGNSHYHFSARLNDI
ncbi:MAG: hypothetical protein JSR33_11950 [Proteobacteria bacterium]|nr:hypothetical protein [Pseudomonadota bacterium]